MESDTSSNSIDESTAAQHKILDVAAEMYAIREQIRRQILPSVLKNKTKEIHSQLQAVKMGWEIQEQPFESSVPVIGLLIVAFRNAWNNVAARWHVRRILNQQNRYNLTVYMLLETLVQEQLRLEEAVAAAEERVEELNLRMLSVRRALVASSDEKSAPNLTQAFHLEKESEESLALDWGYLNFNAEFTALGSVIRELYRQYLPSFEGLDTILDAGCGRGAFLELLKEAGIEGYGVDRESEMVEMCRLKGLQAVEGDILTHLGGLETETLGGIFSGHLIEHFDAPSLQRFFNLAYRCLRTGGVLICETPDTSNPFVLVNTYYRDLTHQRPVHPETYQFAAQSAGFTEVELHYSGAVPGQALWEPLLEPATASAEVHGLYLEMNRRLTILREQFSGYQNVAVIARKPDRDF